MLFWIVAGSLSAVVALLIARPLLAPPRGTAAASDQAVYREQMAEIGRDVQRGTLAPEDAERVRAEVGRRLIAADRAGTAPLREAPRRATMLAVAAVGVAAVLGSLLLYAALGSPGAPDQPRAERIAAAASLRAARPSQAEAEARAAALPRPQPDAPEDYLAMVEELRRAVPTRPEDLRGWELLALHEARLGRFAEAARAQERVIALKGEGASAQDRADLVDRMVAAAGGIVTPEAEAVLAEVAALEPANPALLYYLGLLEAQTGRPDRAFPLWRRLVEEGPADSAYRDLALGDIGEMAARAGAEWEPPPEVAADAQAQTEAIRGMVEGLRERLLAEGGPAEDWARLVTSLAVLGDAAGAAEALERGRAAHEGDEAALAVLSEAAGRAGVGG